MKSLIILDATENVKTFVMVEPEPELLSFILSTRNTVEFVKQQFPNVCALRFAIPKGLSVATTKFHTDLAKRLSELDNDGTVLCDIGEIDEQDIETRRGDFAWCEIAIENPHYLEVSYYPSLYSDLPATISLDLNELYDWAQKEDRSQSWN